MPDDSHAPPTEQRPPAILVDLGKVKKKRIKQLKKGRGPLLEEVHEAVEAVRAELGEEAEGKELLPVVVLYAPKREKAKKRKGRTLQFDVPVPPWPTWR